MEKIEGVAYLEGRFKSNKYGRCLRASMSIFGKDHYIKFCINDVFMANNAHGSQFSQQDNTES